MPAELNQGGYNNLPPTHNNYVSDCILMARIQYAITRDIPCSGSGSGESGYGTALLFVSLSVAVVCSIAGN